MRQRRGRADMEGEPQLSRKQRVQALQRGMLEQQGSKWGGLVNKLAMVLGLAVFAYALVHCMHRL